MRGGRDADAAALEAAAEWFALLASEDAGAAERARCAEWRAADPRHERAWQQVAAVAERFSGGADVAGRAVRGRALASARRERARRRRLLKGMAALALGGPLAWATWRHTPLGPAARRGLADHSTAVGEIRRIRLPDGSDAWLNTASAIDVAMAETRDIRVVAGELLLATARDPRPLRVATPRGLIRPLGTRFSVRRGEAGDTVAVIAGAVEVSPARGGAERLGAGRQGRLTARGLRQVRALDPNTHAWRDGVLVADHLPLGGLLDALGRYRHGVISVDPRVADLPVMGVYPLADTDRTLDQLERALPVRVHRRLPWWVTVAPR